MSLTQPDVLGEQPFKRWIRYPLEGVLASVLFHGFRLLPVTTAARIGGRVARWLGPRLRVSRQARENLIYAFPEKTTAEIDGIVAGMWEHLGQTAAEFPFMDRFDTHDPARVDIRNEAGFELLRDDGETGIMFSAHLANWEVPPLAALQRGIGMIGVYRRANNPFVERLFRKARGWPEDALVPKSDQGARKVFSAMRKGRHLVVMMDQKLNEGIPTTFFGRPAMTSTMVAKYALHFRCPVRPVAVFRTGLCRYRIEVEDPLELPDTGDADRDVALLTQAVTERIEAWIRRHPEQWLWLHNRWRGTV
ncbi:MAG: lauroyl acyltransferase [Alphaproteobacteria bacterium]|nr:lauroyl acyltransferase [Alphaproteobacteria bacterium]